MAYTLVKGQILEGLTIDHLCRNPSCINPSHLEAVSGVVNTKRGDGIGMRNAAKTHCPQGHEYDIHAAYGRRCRRCTIESKRRYNARKRAERLAVVGEEAEVTG